MDETHIELAPVPHGGENGRERAVGLRAAETVSLVRLPLGRDVAVGDHVAALGAQLGDGVLRHAGPAQHDLRVRIRQRGAEREGVDPGGHAVDGVAGDIAEAAGLRHRAGDGAGDELAFIDAAVIGAHAGEGHGHRAVEDLAVGMLRGRPAAGADERGRRGEDHLRPVLDGGVEERVRLRALEGGIGLYAQLVAQDFLQAHSALFVRVDPGALLARAVVDEGHVQMAGQQHRVDQLGEDALPALLRSGAHVDGLRRGEQLRVGQDPLDRGGKLLCRHLLDVGELVELQPQQKQIARALVQLVPALRVQRAFKGAEGGQKALALLVGPNVVRLKAEGGLQLFVRAAAAEPDAVEPAETVEVHELVIEPDLLVLRPDGDDARDLPRDRRRVEALEHADALVALLDVESAEVFIAADRIADALRAEIGIAERDPLAAEFRLHRQQRHEIGGKGVAPSFALGADDAVHRHVDQAELRTPRGEMLVKDLVEDLRVGIFSFQNGLFIAFLPRLERGGILGLGFGNGHVSPPWRVKKYVGFLPSQDHYSMKRRRIQVDK